MKLTVITPTADQPIGMRLLEKYMARQTVKPDQWIVADDGTTPAALTMGQQHLIRKRRHEGGASLAANLLAMIPEIQGDIVVCFEHDDYYAPDHIETCLCALATGGALATGSRWQRYYNLEHRKYIRLRNVGSALCNTAFHAEMIPNLKKAAERAFREKSYGIDRLFWNSVPQQGWAVHHINTVVGMKGLPGRKGLGVGHRPNGKRPWQTDPDGTQLRIWVGNEDAEEYLRIRYA